MITNSYEVVFIINTGIGEDAVTAMVEKFKNLVTSNGTIDSIEEWGKRRLAYPINDLTEGYYVLMNITCPAEFPAELDRIFKITEGILRSLIVVKEVVKISPNTQAKILAREKAKEIAAEQAKVQAAEQAKVQAAEQAKALAAEKAAEPVAEPATEQVAE